MKLFLITFGVLLAMAGVLAFRDVRALAPGELEPIKQLLRAGAWVVVGILFLCFVFIYDDGRKPWQ